MKLKIYDENSINDVEGQLFLRLVMTDDFERHNNDVCLIVVDKNGDDIPDGSILFVDSHFRGIVVLKNINDVIPIKTSFLDKYPLLITEDELIEKLNKLMHDKEIRELQKDFMNKMNHQEPELASKH
jgi:hypothetical protein